MPEIPQWKVKRLIQAGDDYKVPFHFPPFDADITLGFFDINKFKNTKAFQQFLGIIQTLNIKFEYAFTKADKKKVFMVIKMED